MTGNLGVDLLFQFCKCCTIPISVDCSLMIEEVYKESSFTTPKDGEPDLAYSSCCLEFLHCWACHTLPLHWCSLWFWNVMVNPKSIPCNTPIQEYCALCSISCQYRETALQLLQFMLVCQILQQPLCLQFMILKHVMDVKDDAIWDSQICGVLALSNDNQH